jgi:hypothetical protein
MSILLVELVPQGIIFGADRNISSEEKEIKHEDRAEDGVYIEQHHTHYYQSPRPKVLRWPKRRALLGYVGESQICGMHTDEWLYDFIGEHVEFDNFEVLATELKQLVEEQRRIDEGDDKAEELIIHLAGFEEREGIQVPACWVIRNDHSRPPNYLSDIRKAFEAVDCLWTGYAALGVAPKDIRAYLSVQASKFDPLWFHQGYELGAFNLLEAFLKASLKLLYENKLVDHNCPQTLIEWEQQVKMSILMYGAYFQS